MAEHSARRGTISIDKNSLHVHDHWPVTESYWNRDNPQRQQFRARVFHLVADTLRGLGWTVGPWTEAHRYPELADMRLSCSKGTLAGQIDMGPHTAHLELWHQLPDDRDARYRPKCRDPQQMPYLTRLALTNAQRKVTASLIAAHPGYQIARPRPAEMGFMGITAEEDAQRRRQQAGHFPHGQVVIRNPRDARSADEGTIEHGALVFVRDGKGRVSSGIAHHLIGDNWLVVTGRYGLVHALNTEIYVRFPGRKVKTRLQFERLKQEQSRAVAAQDAPRVRLLQDLIDRWSGKPATPGTLFYVASLKHTRRDHEHISFWGPAGSGYGLAISASVGAYTLEEVRRLNDGRDTIAVPVDAVFRLMSPEPYYGAAGRIARFYDTPGPVVDNTRANWQALIAASLEEGRSHKPRPTPFRGVRRSFALPSAAAEPELVDEEAQEELAAPRC